MNFRELTFQEAEAAFLAMQAQVETLKTRVEFLEARLGYEEPPPPVPLKHFATLKDLEEAGESAWERIPEEEAMRNDVDFAMQVKAGIFNKRMRENGWHLPWRNVIVDELEGEVERLGGTGWDAENNRGGLANIDPTCIVNLRILNLTNPIWMRLKQKDDDNWESDRQDQEKFLRFYAERVNAGDAGFRVNTKNWEIYSQFDWALAIVREVLGGDYDTGNPRRPIIPVGV